MAAAQCPSRDPRLGPPPPFIIEDAPLQLPRNVASTQQPQGLPVGFEDIPAILHNLSSRMTQVENLLVQHAAILSSLLARSSTGPADSAVDPGSAFSSEAMQQCPSLGEVFGAEIERIQSSSAAQSSESSRELLPCLFRDGEMYSAGSQDHPTGCRPCSFFCFGKRGCRRGGSCKYCHMRHTTWSGKEYKGQRSAAAEQGEQEYQEDAVSSQPAAAASGEQQATVPPQQEEEAAQLAAIPRPRWM